MATAAATASPSSASTSTIEERKSELAKQIKSRNVALADLSGLSSASSSSRPSGMSDEEHEVLSRNDSDKEDMDSRAGDLIGENHDMKKQKKRKRLLAELGKPDRCGICFLSRIPPHMDPSNLRQILSQYGDIKRIYLAPEDSAPRVQRKKSGGYRGQGFSEGWVEFTNKSVAKRVANMLNGEQIGGRKRSSFYYDLWNIKYLSKFKWDDLTGEIAYKNAVREQKLALEIAAAKRERDFYLSKVDKSRALSSIEKRMKKKQKMQQVSETNPEQPINQQKIIRHFTQTKSVADTTAQSKPRISKDVLVGVFGGSS